MSNFKIASKDFKRMLLAFLQENGVNVDNNGMIVESEKEWAQSLIPEAVCNYLSVTFAAFVKRENFLSSIGLLANILKNNKCRVNITAKDSENMRFTLAVMQIRQTGLKDTDGFILLQSASGSSNIRIPFRSWSWHFKAGLDLTPETQDAIKKFLQKEYEKIVKSPKEMQIKEKMEPIF